MKVFYKIYELTCSTPNPPEKYRPPPFHFPFPVIEALIVLYLITNIYMYHFIVVMVVYIQPKEVDFIHELMLI